MTEIEIWALAVGLAMDCFVVSITSGVIWGKLRWKPMLTMAFFFGLFQALNPFLGWLGTRYFRHLIESVDHWIAFGILAFLGIRMIVESFKAEDEKHFDPASLKVILMMAVATSIDALAVGISFVCVGMSDWRDLPYPLGVIGLVSFLMSLVGVSLGVKCGSYARRIHADLLGGIILFAIGLKVLIEHLSA